MKYPKVGIVSKPYLREMGGSWNEYTVISGRINDLVANNDGIPIGITNVTARENLNSDDCLDSYVLSDKEKEQIDSQLEGLDGVILQGGLETHAYEEYIAKKAMEQRLPLMGICAGFNNIIRASGGTTFKSEDGSHDQDPYKIAHKIEIVPGTNLAKLLGGEREVGVNSVHTILATPDGVPQDKLKVVALTSDGLVEAIEGQNGAPIYGYKFHPEMMATRGLDCYDPRMENLFTDFLDKCRDYQRSKAEEPSRQELEAEVERLKSELKDGQNKLDVLEKENQGLKTRLVGVRDFMTKKCSRIPFVGRMLLNAMKKELGENQLSEPKSRDD